MSTTTVSPGKVSVKVRIMEKEYPIQCEPDEKHQLIKAALDVDTRMRAVKNAAATISAEKAAVMTALNLAGELQGATDNSDMLETVSHSIIDMKSRIEKVLSDKQTDDKVLAQIQS